MQPLSAYGLKCWIKFYLLTVMGISLSTPVSLLDWNKFYLLSPSCDGHFFVNSSLWVSHDQLTSFSSLMFCSAPWHRMCFVIEALIFRDRGSMTIEKWLLGKYFFLNNSWMHLWIKWFEILKRLFWIRTYTLNFVTRILEIAF